MRSVILFLLFLLPSVLSATIRSGTGEWRADGKAKALYETPLGKLYRLESLQGGDLDSIGSRPPHENYASCSCDVCKKGRVRITSVLSLKMPKKVKFTIKTRYIAFDFRIRLFPALEKNGDSRLYFSVLDSESPISGSMLFDLHGMKDIDDISQSDAYVSGQAPWSVPEYRHFRSFVLPVFEPLAVRVIYDLKEKKMWYFLNGRGFEYPAKIHGELFRLQLRHFGIVFVMTYFQNMKEKNKKIKVVHLDRTRYFELSSPQVHVFDDWLELPPPPRFSAYPYGSYSLERTSKNDRGMKVSSPLDQTVFKKVLKHKNPDLQYAYALRYLYGKKDEADPEKGVELLKRSAKKYHALALYQLGICFWRGYGCQPDRKKAAEYLDQAVKQGYPEAAAALLQLEMEQHGRPWFLAEMYHDHIIQLRLQLFGHGHDKYYFLKGPEFLSPKRLWDELPVSRFYRPENPKQNYLDYRLQANDPFSFLAQAVFLNKAKRDVFFRRGEPYLLRALKVKHYEAYPFWLLRQLYADRLPEKEKIPLEMRLFHADNPIFGLVYALLCLPEPERRKYLGKISSENETAQGLRPLEQWDMKRPESGYLRALAQCMRFAYSPNLCLMSSMWREDKEHKWRQNIFELILASAKAGYAPAQYLAGKSFYYFDLPKPWLTGEGKNPAFRLSAAEEYLTAAAEQGHIPAALLWCKLKMNSDFPRRTEILPRLEKLCEMKIPEAFYLKADVLLKLNRKPEALTAAEKAVEMGEHRGLLFLIRHDNRANASAVKRERQAAYIKADRARRQMDPYDPYWDDPLGEYMKWISAATMNISTVRLKHPPAVMRLKTPAAGANGSGTFSRPSSKKEKSKGRSKIRIREE